ncbi:MAG: type IV secretory system conjugative DNA transfer family protein, partial [Bifidobacteriales bacterium]|nr:type IV secretory system conjugative DNA transfer family protein [Bifidobacteriales bacterium]
MRWQAAAALAAAAFAAGDFAAAAIAASGANPILDPEAAMAALRAGRAFSTEALPLCAGTACACAALLAWARSLGSKGARRDGEEHGSSRWATPKDIAPFGDAKDPDNNIILTDSARIRLVSRRFDLSTDTNDNVLVVGGPGTGKTRYYVKPNLLQANASFFVTDPKGTL